MRYNPDIHHRRSIRLKDYDYTQRGLYYITICTQNRACLFGEIANDNMYLNQSGNMIVKWVAEIENKFNDIKIPSFIIMPNHFHAIINTITPVGADLRVCPKPANAPGKHIQGKHIGSPLHGVVQWFKTMTTNEYIRGVKTMGWKSFDRKLWQRNYYEHIICNKQSYIKIVEYIENNPKKWIEDKMYMSP